MFLHKYIKWRWSEECGHAWLFIPIQTLKLNSSRLKFESYRVGHSLKLY